MELDVKPEFSTAIIRFVGDVVVEAGLELGLFRGPWRRKLGIENKRLPFVELELRGAIEFLLISN